jgi:hypothetical protein
MVARSGINAGGRITRPSFGRVTKASMERTSSTVSLNGIFTVSTDSVSAEASIAAIYFWAVGATAGLKMIATVATPGAACLSRSNHLPPIVGSELLNPVMLPSGWEQFQPFPTQGVFELDKAGSVAAWPRHTLDEAGADWVGYIVEHNWHGARGPQ